MRHPSRALLQALALLALAMGAGCGPGLYDAKGVPILTPTCGGDTPLYCASTNSCYAEDASHCGSACTACQPIPNANVFCDSNNPDVTQHVCAFTCDPGFVFDGVGACVCPGGTNACGGATTCSPETVAACGAGCVTCTTPAHAVGACTNGRCTFTCDAASGFVPDNAGGCACPTGTNVCGGATSCARESPASCGPSCVDCARTTPVGAVPTCTAGKCGFACDSASGFVPDGAGGCTCALGSNSCGHPSTCVADTAAVCGASCTACSPPPHAQGTCTNGGCGFQCDGTFISTGGACVCPAGQNACPAATATACAPETIAACGPNCSTCSTTVAHAHPTCGSGQCGFACDTGFTSNGAGGCVCPAGSNVCGAETTCNAESPLRCGASCTTCPVPFGAIASCTSGACGFTCNAAAGFVSDGAGGCTCPAGQNACGGATSCAAETAAACGPNCSVCPTPANGSAVCTASHACGVSCNAGYVPDATGTKCVCAPGTVACGGGAPGGACVAESTTACGSTCTTCTTTVANASATCNVATHTCDFKCNAGFDLVGGNCVCPAGQCLPGGASACVTETPTSCGVGACVDCTTRIPPGAVGATALCTNHACDYACPANQTKCADALGNPSCCAITCAAPTIPCGPPAAPGGPATCINESATTCGGTCTNCATTTPPPPANSTPVCDPNLHVCDFACNPGLFRHAGACVRIATSATALPPPGVGTFGGATVALGARHSCAVLADGGVVCWGANDQGQLGVASPAPGPGVFSSHPLEVVLPGIAVALAAGDAHTCAALSDGTVYCWGANAKGQLGQAISATTPVLVPGLGSVAGIATILAAGANHTCAISGGAVKCWGDNALGQLGTGTAGAATSTPTPTLITTGAIAIAAGGDHTCAIVPAGVVRCWGANGQGELGIGVPPAAVASSATPTTLVFTNQKDPAGVALGTGALAISAGAQHTCIVASGAGGVCWGRALEEELGTQKPPTIQGVPYVAQRTSGNNTSLTAAGGRHSCFSVPTDLAPKCGGDAGTGQAPIAGTLGTCPVDITMPAGLMVSTGIFSGGNHNCVIGEPFTLPVAPGTGPFSLMCWGVNDAGQLGNGTTAPATTTTAIPQLVVGQ